MGTEHFMPEEELFNDHPLPWTHHVLMIKDANQKTVIHLGGTPSHSGHSLSGFKLCTLASFIVETANSKYEAWLEREIVHAKAIALLEDGH